MPKGGVNELLKSPSGRAYLGELQKRYWKETLQPSDPRFEKVYGKEIREREEKMERNRRDYIEEYNEKKKYDKQNQWRTR